MSIDINEFNIFNVEFHTEKSHGRITKDSYDDMMVYLNEFCFTLCEAEDFNEFVEIETLKVGKKMSIDGVNVIIDAIDVETHEESNSFWEQVEMDEMNHL